MAITNLQYLDNVTDGNKMLMREMIELFLQQIPEFITNMQNHLEKGKIDELGREAHKAKSSLQILGMVEMEEEMKMFYAKTKDKRDKQSYAGHIERFSSQCLAAADELKAIMASW